jgi:murein DD-endopeptidase MepM/ murein hydrolase activator NlpD
MDGVVDMSGWRSGYGRLVEIRHAHGLSTRYGHLHAFADHIHIGSHVHRGDVIGYVGSTGLSTGPHLYYEVWDHGKRINPLAHRQWMVAVHLPAHERRQLAAYVNGLLAAK